METISFEIRTDREGAVYIAQKLLQDADVLSVYVRERASADGLLLAVRMRKTNA